MKLLTSPKLQYLLEAGVEVLHAESQEWLDEINFVQDELKIFDHLLFKFSNKTQKNDPNQYEELILRDIQHWKHMLNELHIAIVEHEKYLAGLARLGLTGNADEYRSRHRSLTLEMIKTRDEFTQYRKSLLKFITGLI